MPTAFTFFPEIILCLQAVNDNALDNNQINNQEELLQRVAQGDEIAFRTLFTFYQPRLYTAALRMVGDADLAKDIYQDVFLRVWLKRTSLVNMDNFPGWLFTVARNLIYDSLKHAAQKKSNPLDFHLDSTVDITYNPEILLKGKEVEQVLHAAIERLPDKQLETYRLIKLEGFSRAEAAEKMKISPETVKSNLEIAIRKIRAYCLKELSSNLVFLLFATELL